MSELAQIAKDARAWACYDCGKCTATCPITLAGARYSPRHHVLAASHGRSVDITGDGSLFTCLTCRTCDSRCPVGVDYIGLVRSLRELAYREGAEVECPHGGALQSAMRIMAKGVQKQERLGWLTDDLQTEPEKGQVFYWTGCTMYYDAFFPEFGMRSLDGTTAAIRLLNRAGVTPVVSPEERCCGHDLLWTGDGASFVLLAQHNMALVQASGVETVVVSCAECLRTWKEDYLPLWKGKAPRLVHISEFACEHLEELGLKDNGALRVTYQDPCRLGRHLGMYDAPRQMLQAIPGVELTEMPRSGKRALCCAGGTWSNCDRYAKKLQVERLREAKATGAELLVTACPKCQVHFRCAMQDPNLKDEIEIPMRDVAELVADAMG
jgi:Fe-S oxidoreductase